MEPQTLQSCLVNYNTLLSPPNLVWALLATFLLFQVVNCAIQCWKSITEEDN